MISPNSPSSLFITYRYDVHEQLGAGAMGVVYRAYDRLSGEYVALKRVMMATDNLLFQSHGSPVANPRLALAHEFRMLATLRHPNIISVQDYGFDDSGRPYFTMSLLDTPQTIVNAGHSQPVDKQIDLLVQALQALAYIHQRGLLHRDIKPSNILVRDGRTYVLDFGLAEDRERVKDEETVGTLAYIAPEVLSGGRASEASDLYAIGVIAYEMIAGVHPYDRGDVVQLMTSIVQKPVDLTMLDIDTRLRAVLGQILAKDPRDRYTTARDTIEALCAASGQPLPEETADIRESYLQAARFVGRETELSRLDEALENAMVGQGSTWLIGGESGVGKSRLLEELRTRALVRGALVLRGQAVNENGLPYQMWRDPIRRLALMGDYDDDDATILTQIVPDLGTLLDRELPPPPDVDILTYQKRLFLIIEMLIRQVVQQRPVVLLLEDLQWGTESLKLVEQLNQLVADLPLMLATTYTSDSRPDMPQELPQMEHLYLERLSRQEIARLSRSMLGDSGRRPDVVDLLERETEGNVFFLIEVVRTLAADAGRLSAIGSVTLPAQVMAGGIQRVIEARLQRVPSWALPMVEIAAVAGRYLDLKVLQAIDPDLDLDRWLAVCTGAAVFDVQDERTRFAHDKLREGVLKTIPQEHKPEIHHHIAAGIETVYEDSLDEYAIVLAQHWAAANNHQGEARYVVEAAKQAYKSNHYTQARSFYQRAIQLEVHRQEDSPDKSLADLKHGLGITYYNFSEYNKARELYREALVLYRKIDDRVGMGETLSALGEVDSRQGNFDRARTFLRESMAIRQELGDQKNIGYGLMNMGVIEVQQGNIVEARELFQQCHDIMRQQNEPISEAKALNNLGNVNDMLGDSERALELHREALKIRRRLNDRHGIAYSLLNMAAIVTGMGNYDEAHPMATEALALLRTIGERLAMCSTLSTLGTIAIMQKRYRDARQHYEEVLMLQQDMDNKSGIVGALQGLGTVERELGHYAQASDYYHQALTLAKQVNATLGLLEVLVASAKLIRITGNSALALEILLPTKSEFEARQIPTRSIDEELAQLGIDLRPPEFLAARERGLAHSLDSVVTRCLEQLAASR